MLALAYQAYEDDLCPGCGWPRTYSMHKEADKRWTSPEGGVRCHGCAARDRAEEKSRKDKNRDHSGLRFPIRPTDGMWHAMSDPTLTYDDTFDQVGATGLYYPATDDDG